MILPIGTKLRKKLTPEETAHVFPKDVLTLDVFDKWDVIEYPKFTELQSKASGTFWKTADSNSEITQLVNTNGYNACATNRLHELYDFVTTPATPKIIGAAEILRKQAIDAINKNTQVATKHAIQVLKALLVLEYDND